MDAPPADTLSPALRERVLARLGLTGLRPDLPDLRRAYRAWCRNVPFDNVRKTTALFGGWSGPLPEIDAADFLETWLADGLGGTCWPSCNALFTLLSSCGFDVERAAASMFDAEALNHGTIVARAAGGEWLVDSSMLTDEPVPLREGRHEHPLLPVEVEGVGGANADSCADGACRVWFRTGTHAELVPCRLRRRGVDLSFFRERYEASRASGPFNERLYARRNADAEVRVLRGRTLHVVRSQGATARELEPDALGRALTELFGLSVAAVRRWERSGAFEANATGELPPPTAFAELPPSRRARPGSA